MCLDFKKIAKNFLGTGVFVGAGVYTYVSGRAALRENQAKILKSGSMFGLRSRHLALGTTSLALVGAGVYRWLN